MTGLSDLPARDRFASCLVGGAVGDALGAPVEFLTWSEIVRSHGSAGVTTLAVKAAFTDDTQMTLFTAEGLIRASVRLRAKGITSAQDVVHRAYLRWLQTQTPQPFRDGVDGEGWLAGNKILHQRRAPGATCLSALGSGRVGTAEEPLNDSKGCGAVMRMAPVGLFLAGQPHDAWQLGCELGALTHGHREGYQSAGALAALIAATVTGEAVGDAVERTIAIAGDDGPTGTTSALQSGIDLAESGPCDPDVLCDRLGEGWVGEEALAVSVCCVLAYSDPIDALRASVNHRGDSDSTGSITGNILGAAHELSWLDPLNPDRLDGADLVRAVAEDLWTERYDPPNTDEQPWGGVAPAWFDRYPGY